MIASAARRNVLAGTVGSVLEWYDFALYGYLAPIIGTLFFPADDPVASLLVVPSASLSDRIGRKPVLYLVAVGMFALAWPLWRLMLRGSFAAVLAGQVGFAVLLGLAYGVIPAAMSEMLPAEIRCTAVGLGYNLSLGIFAGTAPLIATYLVARTADDFIPAYYVMALAAVSFIALLGLPETAGKPLA